MNLLILLAALLPFPSFALNASNPELVRILDGNAVRCREAYEAGKVTYNPSVSEVSMEQGVLGAHFEISFVSCAIKGEDLALEPILPLAPHEHRNEQGELIRIEYRDADFLVGDANFGSAVTTPLEDRISQAVNVRLELDKVLTQQQRRELAAGKSVRARMTLMARRIATLVKNGDRTPLGQRFLGSFTFFVTISP